MVDTRFIDLRSIPADTRYRVFDYLWNVKRVGSRGLGISPALANMIKNRKRGVTDSLLKRMLELLSPEEYAELVEGATTVRVDPNTFVKILVTAITDPTLKPILVEIVKNRLAAEIFAEITRYTVTKQDLEEFREWLNRQVRIREKSCGLSEGISRDTASKHWKYLNELLTYLGYSFTLQRLEDLRDELIDEFGYAKARHMLKAFRKFVKVVIRKRNRTLASQILEVVKVPKDKSKEMPLMQRIILGYEKTPTIDEIRRVAKALTNIGAQLAFIMLAETGLRPVEIFNLTMEQVDLSNRVIRPLHLSKTKRAYISFISKPLHRFIAEKYLPWRDWFLEQYQSAVSNIGRDVEKWRNKFIPLSEDHIRAEIKLAMEKTGVRFELYKLRSFFISWMLLRKIPGEIVAVFTGQASLAQVETILRHYFGGSIEKLRKFYDENAPKILEKV